jgi:hypothetical protein
VSDAPTRRALAVLTVEDGRDPAPVLVALRALAGAVPELRASHAGVHLGGVVGPPGMGAGAITWDLVLDAAAPHTPGDVLADPAAHPLAGAVTVATELGLDPIASRRVATPGPLVKRTLLLRVRPDAPADARSRFESDLAEMPDHIGAIRSWSLSRTTGTGRFTHAWEQEYASLDGLTGEYMLHPFHWTTVDAWFDPEMPDHLVGPELAHLFATYDESVL